MVNILEAANQMGVSVLSIPILATEKYSNSKPKNCLTAMLQALDTWVETKMGGHKDDCFIQEIKICCSQRILNNTFKQLIVTRYGSKDD